MKHTPASEFALLLLKPDVNNDGLKRQHIHEAYLRDFRELCMLEDFQLSPHAVDTLYVDHVGKTYYAKHKDFMMSAPVSVYLLERKRQNNVTAPEQLRLMIGNTDPQKAAMGTWRRLFGSDLPRNAVHASDSVSAVTREARFFFSGIHLLNVGASALVGSVSSQLAGSGL